MHASHRKIAVDQAVALRQLVRDARDQQPPRDPTAPHRRGRMIVIAGAKGGVGVSTVALRMAHAIAERQAVMLVDANLRQPDLAHIAGLEAERAFDLADVLAGMCQSADALVAVGENLSLLPGAWAPGSQPDATNQSVARWMSDLTCRVESGESLVIDAGVGMKPWTEPLWRAATWVVLVTTPTRISMLDAYATCKLARAEQVSTPLRLLLNRTRSQSQAELIHNSFDSTCQKFLGETFDRLAWVADDEAFAETPTGQPAWRCCRSWAQVLCAESALSKAG